MGLHFHIRARKVIPLGLLTTVFHLDGNLHRLELGRPVTGASQSRASCGSGIKAAGRRSSKSRPRFKRRLARIVSALILPQHTSSTDGVALSPILNLNTASMDVQNEGCTGYLQLQAHQYRTKWLAGWVTYWYKYRYLTYAIEAIITASPADEQ